MCSHTSHEYQAKIETFYTWKVLLPAFITYFNTNIGKKFFHIPGKQSPVALSWPLFPHAWATRAVRERVPCGSRGREVSHKQQIHGHLHAASQQPYSLSQIADGACIQKRNGTKKEGSPGGHTLLSFVLQSRPICLH